MSLNKIITKGTLALIVLLLAELLFLYYENWPLPVISNSISLDAKLYHFKKSGIKNVKVLSIGSSMTLNNLNSGVVRSKLSDSYYNLGAWGLQVSDTRYLLNYYRQRVRPKYVIIGSSITDFRHKGQLELPSYGELYLAEKYPDSFYFINPRLRQVMDRQRDFQSKEYTSDQFYSNLSFDRNGGAALRIPKSGINLKRWNEQLAFPSKWTEYQYRELEKLATDLDHDNIKLIFVQTPMRKALAEGAIRNEIHRHVERCRSIVENSHGIYLDYLDTDDYPDRYFVDQNHLSEEGAVIMTTHLVHDLGGTVL